MDSERRAAEFSDLGGLSVVRWNSRQEKCLFALRLPFIRSGTFFSSRVSRPTHSALRAARLDRIKGELSHISHPARSELAAEWIDSALGVRRRPGLKGGNGRGATALVFCTAHPARGGSEYRASEFLLYVQVLPTHHSDLQQLPQANQLIATAAAAAATRTVLPGQAASWSGTGSKVASTKASRQHLRRCLSSRLAWASSQHEPL